ncbi:transcriptional regulator [Gluconobacter thailandicus F149-1 = NBRC 100600]|uniref:DeoR family transcriptional regulator n=1 Tax=Gluconobacter thailandicus NBRC 3257 TaxID=1381097 RepID=A0ABQ0J049_GLUTH|nr:DeoR/GlpR family DNA-binding transcription regulator [Gluconobacter thailandicus]GAN91218.1 transcriptional regulator [Gluconobacter frateurii M-2]KXV54966.1 DeoR family transcriptional regulator [Gluconobacter thailandicus]GAC89428.1 DeoR family transcriptional regulator [Gluconobacter thailandicus NBRC 3255]GAD27833.1 DeoR family transcriptional regulator [Gluconobacter thailandicus NBRC 3257]GAN94870.1 transcriptional regulator [Gluconobacter thailandicus F149-1 = NBRC 100600]
MTSQTTVESCSASVRRQNILNYVRDRGGAQIDELAGRFVASRMTIHRDLQVLSERGVVCRVYGGVTTPPKVFSEGSVAQRSNRAVEAKQAIAILAESLVQEGDIIALDDSTTSRFLSERLTDRSALTVVTNSMGTANLFAAKPNVNLLLLGGRYNMLFDAFFGTLCEQAAASLRVNTLFMSVAAIRGMTAYHQEQDIIKAKQALMNISDRKVLLVDSTKFGVITLNRFSELTEFDVVITDSGLEKDVEHTLRSAGINLKIAEISTARLGGSTTAQERNP